MSTIEANSHIMSASGPGERVLYALDSYGAYSSSHPNHKLSNLDLDHGLGGRATSIAKIGRNTQQIQNTSGSSQFGTQSVFNITSTMPVISTVTWDVGVDNIACTATTTGAETALDMNTDFASYTEPIVKPYNPAFTQTNISGDSVILQNGKAVTVNAADLLAAYKKGECRPNIVPVKSWGYALVEESRVQINGTTVSNVSGRGLLYHALNNTPGDKSISYQNAGGTGPAVETRLPQPINQNVTAGRTALHTTQSSCDQNAMSDTIRDIKASIVLNWPTNHVPGGGMTNLTSNATMRQLTIKKASVYDIIAIKATVLAAVDPDHYMFRSNKYTITTTGLSQNSVSVSGYTAHPQLMGHFMRDHDQAQVNYLIEVSAPMTGQTVTLVPPNLRGLVTSFTAFTVAGTNNSYDNQHRDSDWCEDRLIVRRFGSLMNGSYKYEVPTAEEPIAGMSLIVGGNTVASTNNKHGANAHSALSTELGGPHKGCTMAIGTHLKPTEALPQGGISTEQQQQITVTVNMSQAVCNYLTKYPSSGCSSTGNSVHVVLTCANVLMTDRMSNTVTNIIT